MKPQARPADAMAARHRRVGAWLGLVAISMVGVAYAAVPLYRIFCQVTGYGGTPQIASAASDRVLDKTITVRFDANVARALGWEFQPTQRTVEVKLGESVLAHYSAKNPSAIPTKGTATFNVTPDSAGAYFNKIACFCFTEQKLEPGQMVDMPVTFFVDPAILDDPDARKLSEITLSYTFYPIEEPHARAAEPERPAAQPAEKPGGRS
ncbi:MAG: cytochrome c oxidase assembly protein [Hyphomicrobiaceae bacterium]|nr:cytochrome c oxidase assembly protein [Hyphomicrobiaceae bacterium]